MKGFILHDRKRPILIHLILALLALLLSLLTLGCATVQESFKLPQSDDTPPSVRMIVALGEEAFEITPTSPPKTINLLQGQKLTIIAEAKDEDGGVKNVVIKSFITTLCQDPQHSDVMAVNHYHPKSENPDEAQPGETVSKVKYTHQDLEVGWLRAICEESDMVFDNFSGTVQATAENFYGGITKTAILTIKHP